MTSSEKPLIPGARRGAPHRAIVVGGGFGGLRAVAALRRGIGLQTVRAALGTGHTVSTLSRTTPDVEHSALRAIIGDARDPQALTRALQGADAVISTIGGAKPFRKTTIFSETARALVNTMGETAARRLIAVTGFGAGDTRGHGGLLMDRVILPLALPAQYADKDRQEAIIRQSKLDWTLVRPGILTNRTSDRVTDVLTTPATYRLGQISRGHLAAFLLDCADHGRYLRQTPVIIES